ncbi:MAG TPA: helix-turn-helix domain-containing protein [Vicinamibacterales bacterium]|nr:helix-turn-helix domain-containing protein [Vicinamibacterales bacterium]
MPRRHARLVPIETTSATPTTADAPSSGVAIVTRERAAGALVAPTRRKILSLLQTPGSATSIGPRLGLSRQLANYHIRALESAGLVEEVDRRQRRGLEERVVRATAAHYLLSPDALGTVGPGPHDVADKFSATYQVAVAARTIREVADLAERARRAGKRLTTLTLDTEVRFAAPADREAFANELVETVTRLVAKYHDGRAADGRTYRVFLGAHPTVPAAKKQPAPRGERSRDRHE